MTSSETPVMSIQQQRQSLSAQKKGPLKGLKNVLAQPYHSFWPALKGDESKTLIKLIKENLGVIKETKKKIPWSSLRKLGKEQRQQIKATTLIKLDPIHASLKNSVVTGINAVARCLENDIVCSVLLDASVEPQLLVKHLIIMAQNHKIPVLLLPSLRSVISNSIGYAAAAIAFKKMVAEKSDHKFHIIHAKISELNKESPSPKNPVASVEVESIDQINENKVFIPRTTTIHLYRQSQKERVFVPPPSLISKNPIIDLSGNDFIPLMDDSDSECTMNRYKRNSVSVDSTYVGLKVKRIRGNENRVKATKLSKAKRKKF